MYLTLLSLSDRKADETLKSVFSFSPFVAHLKNASSNSPQKKVLITAMLEEFENSGTLGRPQINFKSVPEDEKLLELVFTALTPYQMFQRKLAK